MVTPNTKEPPRIGIAVCTYNRADTLRLTISKIKTHTRANYELIVIDDGSSDHTVEVAKEFGVNFLSCKNRGIAWNKNRAIFYLKNFAKTEAIIIIEDDTFPLEDGWEKNWAQAIGRWGHVNLAARYWNGTVGGTFHEGEGSPERPYKCTHISAQCLGFSAGAIDTVGYMDSRFRAWGMEHVEHTDRMVRAGFGGEVCTPLNRHLYYLIDSNLEVTLIDESAGIESDKKQDLIQKSLDIWIKIGGDNLHRDPWINDEEMALFLSEFNKFRKEKLLFWIRTEEAFGMCYNTVDQKIFCLARDNLYKNKNLKKVMGYYDESGLRLCLQERGALTFIMDDLTLDDGHDRSNDERHLRFNVQLDAESGMYLQSDGLYATCLKGLDWSVSIDRIKAQDWERFYFDHFEINRQFVPPYGG